MDRHKNGTRVSHNPWLGLRTYTEEECLYGRDKDVTALTSIVTNNVATVLFGRSGIGKSSLLHAGVFPALRSLGNLPVYVRLEHNTSHSYIGQVISAILSVATVHDRLPKDIPSYGLWDFLHRHDFYDLQGSRVSPVITIDQFEEIFTLPDASHQGETKRLFEEFADVLNNVKPERLLKQETEFTIFQHSEIGIDNHAALKIQIPTTQKLDYKAYDDFRFIISLREDYLCYLERNTSQIPALKVNRYALRALDARSAQDVICLPIPGLYSKAQANEIIDKLAAKDEDEEKMIDPTLLSIYLYRSFTHQEAGKRDNIIEEFYAEETKELQERNLAFLEEHLITGQGFRQAIPYNDAIEYGVKKEELSMLIASRIITIEPKRGHDYIEFSHDVLCSIAKNGRDKRFLRQEKAKLRKRIIIASVGIIAAMVVTILFLSLTHLVHEKEKKVQALNTINVSVHASYLTEKGDVLSAIGELTDMLTHVPTAGTFPHETETALYAAYDSLSSRYANIAHLHHANDVNSAMFSPDDKHIITSCSNDCCYIWNAHTGRKTMSLSGHHDKVNHIEFSHDGKLAISASADKSSILWNTETGRQKCTLRGHTNDVLYATFSPNDKYAVTASMDSTIRLWNVRNGKEIKILSHLTDRVTSCHFSKDGKNVLVSSSDGKTQVVSMAEKEKTRILNDTNMPTRAYYSNDNKYIVTVSSSLIQVLDTQGKILCNKQAAQETSFTNAAFSPNGQCIAFTCGNGDIGLWNWQGTEPATMLRGHSIVAKHVSFSHDGKHLVSSGRDNLAKIWNLADAAISLNCNKPIFVTFSKDGKQVASVTGDSLLYIWQTGKPSYKLLQKKGLPFFATSVSFDKESSKVVVTGADGTISIYDKNKAEPLYTIRQPRSYNYAFFTENTNEVMAISNEHATIIWNYKTSKTKERFLNKHEKLNGISLSPDKKWYMTALTDSNNVFLESCDSTSSEIVLKGHLGEVQCVTFNRDGRYAASGGMDNDIIIWNLTTLKETEHIKGHSSQVYFVEFISDGKYLFSMSTDKTARIWNTTSKKTIRTFNNISPSQMGIAVLDNDKKVIIAYDNQLRIINIPSYEEIINEFEQIVRE